MLWYHKKSIFQQINRGRLLVEWRLGQNDEKLNSKVSHLVRQLFRSWVFSGHDGIGLSLRQRLTPEYLIGNADSAMAQLDRADSFHLDHSNATIPGLNRPEYRMRVGSSGLEHTSLRLQHDAPQRAARQATLTLIELDLSLQLTNAQSIR